MKKTLFVASLLACALPVSADAGLTLSGEGIANNCWWNLYATFDSLTETETFTTLATVNLDNMTSYSVAYTYVGNTLTLGMAGPSNTAWTTMKLNDVNVSDTPVSFSLFHNGSHEGGDNTLSLRAATNNAFTSQDFKISISDSVSASTAEKHNDVHLTNVSLSPALSGVNLVAARLEHEKYSDTAFKEFILEEQPWDTTNAVRYTTESGNTILGDDSEYVFATQDGEVTFNPERFKEGTLKLNKTIQMNARTTFIVDDDKTVTINGAKEFKGTDGEHEMGSVFGKGELVKSGGGTLQIRLNDTNRDIGQDIDNDYEGSVTVEEGTLSLLHQDKETVIDSAHKARLGGGKDTVITVREGATLEMGDRTEISIPLGAHASQQDYAHGVVIDGGAVNVKSDPDYGIPHLYQTSTIKNAIIDRDGLKRVDEDVRAQLIVSGISVFDARKDDGVMFKHADIITDSFYFNGHTVIDNTNLLADDTLIASSFGTEGLFTLDVVNGSHVVYGASGTDAHTEGVWAHTDNVHVDKTSKMQTAANELAHDWGGALQIQGKCTLDIADIKLPGDDKGLAVRTDGTVKAVTESGNTLTLKDIRYVTDQLSGDMLVRYGEDVKNSLNLNLQDPVDALPDGKKLENTVFTLTLKNFDSSLLIKKGDAEGYLMEDVANLTIDAFKDTQWHLVYGRYDAKTNDTIFTFSTMNDLVEITTPEPATATLSLLALAALAARRKRK